DADGIHGSCGSTVAMGIIDCMVLPAEPDSSVRPVMNPGSVPARGEETCSEVFDVGLEARVTPQAGHRTPEPYGNQHASNHTDKRHHTHAPGEAIRDDWLARRVPGRRISTNRPECAVIREFWPVDPARCGAIPVGAVTDVCRK